MRDLIEYGGISDIVPHTSNCYKILNLQGTMSLPDSFPSIESICKFNTIPSIINIEIKDTPCSTSSIGQTLTGKKLNFQGVLNNTLEYSSPKSSYNINIFEFYHEFCDYIILPEDYIESSFLGLVPYVHYCNIIKISEHKFFYNVCLGFSGD